MSTIHQVRSRTGTTRAEQRARFKRKLAACFKKLNVIQQLVPGDDPRVLEIRSLLDTMKKPEPSLHFACKNISGFCILCNDGNNMPYSNEINMLRSLELLIKSIYKKIKCFD